MWWYCEEFCEEVVSHDFPSPKAIETFSPLDLDPDSTPLELSHLEKCGDPLNKICFDLDLSLLVDTNGDSFKNEMDNGVEVLDVTCVEESLLVERYCIEEPTLGERVNDSCATLEVYDDSLDSDDEYSSHLNVYDHVSQLSPLDLTLMEVGDDSPLVDLDIDSPLGDWVVEILENERDCDLNVVVETLVKLHEEPKNDMRMSFIDIRDFNAPFIAFGPSEKFSFFPKSFACLFPSHIYALACLFHGEPHDHACEDWCSSFDKLMRALTGTVRA